MAVTNSVVMWRVSVVGQACLVVWLVLDVVRACGRSGLLLVVWLVLDVMRECGRSGFWLHG